MPINIQKILYPITKRDIFYAFVFLFGITIYCFFTRYELIINGSVVYKINRFTGKVYYSLATAENWLEVGEPNKKSLKHQK